jgi:hypothetical protein
MRGGDARPSEETNNRVEDLHLRAAAGEVGVGKVQGKLLNARLALYRCVRQ